MRQDGPGELIGPAFTDVAGEEATEVQRLRQYSRYLWAAEYCDGKTVVEVACGTGQGLAVLSDRARVVLGGDYSSDNLRRTRETYEDSVPLLRLDAHHLPLADGSVDVVLLLETLYFLPRPEAFVAEARRVLRPGGRLLISVINKDCWDFNPSPLYPRFFGMPELAQLLAQYGFAVTGFGAFPLDRPSARQRFFHPIKRLAIALHLIPRTVQARRLLKRLVFGKLVQLPREIRPGDAPYVQPVAETTDGPDTVHQVVLVEGVRRT